MPRFLNLNHPVQSTTSNKGQKKNELVVIGKDDLASLNAYLTDSQPTDAYFFRNMVAFKGKYRITK